MKKILVIVDMQNDFMQKDGALYVNGADTIIEKTNAFLNMLPNKAIDGILITKDTHDASMYKDSDEGKMFPNHCISGTKGHDLAINLDVIDKKIPIYIMEKDVFDMWAKKNPITPYKKAPHKENFFDDVKKAYVIGVASDFCVKDAIIGLLKRDVKVKWIYDLSKGINEQAPEVASKLDHKNLALVTMNHALQRGG